MAADIFADMMVEFEDRISAVIAWASEKGITDTECADELRRIADTIKAERQRGKRR